jgi:dTDP-4-amino-4,6-dideoxygalactose transaminase
MTGQMTPGTLEAALSHTPRIFGEKWIVIPVSLQGRPLDYAGLKAVAEKYNAVLIEDAAHGISGFYSTDGRKFKMGGCGHTHAAIASFHSLKQLTLGEGGAVMTNDDALAAKVRLLRSHGIVRPGRKEDPSWYYEQTDLGFHYRISDIHCALGLSQLKKLDLRYARRQQLAQRYDSMFSQAPFRDHFHFVPGVEGHAYHLYKIHFADEDTRNAAHEFLKTKGFLTQVLYTPLYHFPYHRDRFGLMVLPGAEDYFKGALAIPLFPKMTDDQQQAIIEALSEFCTGLPKKAVEPWNFKVSVLPIVKPEKQLHGQQ